ncbi:MAG: CARDB domain-containing protein, partial [Calditrichia bacterium]
MKPFLNFHKMVLYIIISLFLNPSTFSQVLKDKDGSKIQSELFVSVIKDTSKKYGDSTSGQILLEMKTRDKKTINQISFKNILDLDRDNDAEEVDSFLDESQNFLKPDETISVFSDVGQISPFRIQPGQIQISPKLKKSIHDSSSIPRSDIKGLQTLPNGWTSLMEENFEGSFPADNGWDRYYNSNSNEEGYGYTWDDHTYRPHSGSYSGWCADINLTGKIDLNPPGPYPDDLNSWMIYGPFDLTNAIDAELLFYYWNESETDHDWFGWYASTDASHFYGTRVSGDQSSWTYNNFDLTDVYTLGNLCGEPEVWIAFIFSSDASVSYEGTYVDDIVLQADFSEKPDLICSSTAFPSATVAEGESYWIRPTIRNDGDGSAGSSHARLFLSTDNDFDTSDDYEVTPKKSVSSLAPGAETEVQWDFDFPDLGSGTYDVWIIKVIDCDNEVAES